jgi:uncharacterized membrane protein
MIFLALGIILFFVLHSLSAIPRLKAMLKLRYGRKAYGTAFGIASLLALAVLVLGWRSSESVAVYDSTTLGWYASLVLNFVGFLCLGIFLFRGNFRQVLRFSFDLAMIFWAAGHLFANGDLASVILFGGLLLGSIAHILVAISNGVRPSPEVRAGHDGLSLIFGAALYGIMTQLHPALIGVPIFVLTR